MSSFLLFATALVGVILGAGALWLLQKIGLFKRSHEGPPSEDKEQAVRLEVRANHLHEHVHKGPQPEFDRAFGLGLDEREEDDAGSE